MARHVTCIARGTAQDLEFSPQLYCDPNNTYYCGLGPVPDGAADTLIDSGTRASLPSPGSLGTVAVAASPVCPFRLHFRIASHLISRRTVSQYPVSIVIRGCGMSISPWSPCSGPHVIPIDCGCIRRNFAALLGPFRGSWTSGTSKQCYRFGTAFTYLLKGPAIA